MDDECYSQMKLNKNKIITSFSNENFDVGSSNKHQNMLESYSFQRSIKNKQGKLFTEEPDYLKGFGLHGDGDDNQIIVTANSSFCKQREQNNSFLGQRESESFIIQQEDTNLQKDQIQIQQNNRIEGQSNEIVMNDIGKKQMSNIINVSINQTDSYNESFLNIHRCESPNENYERIQNKIQEAVKSNFLENPYENITSNTSRNNNSKHNYESNLTGIKLKPIIILKQNQNENQLANRRKMSTKLQLNVKSNHKLVEKLIDVQMAKNIIQNVFNKTSNRQNRIKMLVNEFINKLKELWPNRRLNQLSENEYCLINDYTFFYTRNKNSDAYTCQILGQLTQLKQYIPKISVFNPTDFSLIIWDCFLTFFSYFFFYIISILIFFDYEHKESQFIQCLQIIACFLFFLDILINFNIAYYNSDSAITNRKLIAKKYIKQNFLFDVISFGLLLFRIYFLDTSLQYNPEHSILIYGKNLLVFIKLFALSEKKKRIQDAMIVDESQKHFIKMAQLLLFTAITAHIVGTIWYLIAIIESFHGLDRNWINILRLEGTPYYTRYIYSVYWTVTTMCTIGYGDITPTNQYESLFSTISMIFLSCVFAYSINNIGMIMQEIEKNSKTLSDEINTFQRKKVNLELKSRVRNYLKFLSDESKNRDKEKEDQIFNKLSNKLRDEVTTEINAQLLNKYQIFSNSYSKQTLNRILFAMKEVLISPNEIIFKDNDLDDQSIYFIQDGIIEIFHNVQRKSQSQLRIKILSKNECFGEIAFFSGSQRSASARSLTLSTLYKITRQDFIQIVKQNQNDFEKFKMIQDKISNLNDLSCIYLKCYNCQKSNHIVSNCPNIHQRFDKQLISLKNVFSQEQPRVKKSRKLKLKQNSRMLFNKYQTLIQLIRDNFESQNSMNQLSFQDVESEQLEQNSSQSSSQTFNIVEQLHSNNKSQQTQQLIHQHILSDNQLSHIQQDEGSIKIGLESKNNFHDSQHSSEQRDSSDNKKNTKMRMKSNLNNSQCREGINSPNHHYSSYQQIINDMWIFFINHQQQVLTNIRYKKLDKLSQLDQVNSIDFFKSFRSMNTNQYKKTQTLNSQTTKKVTFDHSNKSDEDQFDKSDQSSPHRESNYPLKSKQTLNLPDNYDNPQQNRQGICSLDQYNSSLLIEPQKSLKDYSSVFPQYQQSQLNIQNYCTNTKISKISNYLSPSFSTISGIKSLQKQQSLGSQLKQQLPQFQNLDSLSNKIENSDSLQKKYTQEQSKIFDFLLDVSKSLRKERQNEYEKEKNDQNEINYDILKQYKHYFPHNNFDKIMHEYKVKKQEQQLIDLIIKKNQNNSNRSKKPTKNKIDYFNYQQRISYQDSSQNYSFVQNTPQKLTYGVLIPREKMAPTRLEL